MWQQQRMGVWHRPSQSLWPAGQRCCHRTDRWPPWWDWQGSTSGHWPWLHLLSPWPVCDKQMHVSAVLPFRKDKYTRQSKLSTKPNSPEATVQSSFDLPINEPLIKTSRFWATPLQDNPHRGKKPHPSYTSPLVYSEKNPNPKPKANPLGLCCTWFRNVRTSKKLMKDPTSLDIIQTDRVRLSQLRARCCIGNFMGTRVLWIFSTWNTKGKEDGMKGTNLNSRNCSCKMRQQIYVIIFSPRNSSYQR